jgi:carbon-monoxide dehydrogenase medium subunit
VLVVLGPGGRRKIPVTEFFAGYFETALTAAEIRVPRTDPSDCHYEKFVRRAQ